MVNVNRYSMHYGIEKRFEELEISFNFDEDNVNNFENFVDVQDENDEIPPENFQLMEEEPVFGNMQYPIEEHEMVNILLNMQSHIQQYWMLHNPVLSQFLIYEPPVNDLPDLSVVESPDEISDSSDTNHESEKNFWSLMKQLLILLIIGMLLIPVAD